MSFLTNSTHHALGELGDPVDFQDEQTDAGESEEQEDAHSLMMLMIMMVILSMMLIKTYHYAESRLLPLHPLCDLTVNNPHPPIDQIARLSLQLPLAE